MSIIFQIAVEGCCHGELDAIYSHIAKLEEREKYKVDLLLICGDFQAIRNHQDLNCMAVPQKYRQLGEFHKYVVFSVNFCAMFPNGTAFRLGGDGTASQYRLNTFVDRDCKTGTIQARRRPRY